MIEARIRKDADDNYRGFLIRGHAEYDDPGKDVVCAAVSMLAINTVNALEKLCGVAVEAEQEKESGTLKVSFPEVLNEKGQLLMDALVLGLKGVEGQYDAFLKVEEERQERR
ncbi:MAG: ribosomal-processing cysteine protease Prp [Lachnospiraceae bacterium]|nr:ribosomal-processing cysteine protease Prp [Lachnospiraceae bacterium]